MQFAAKCLIGLAILASPCAYDPDSTELPAPTAVASTVSPVGPASADEFHQTATLVMPATSRDAAFVD